MSKSATSRPAVNLEGLQEQMLLQVELMAHDAQLRNFTPLRDRLVASGRDADAKYREIQSRRDQLRAELRRLRPARVHPAAGRPSVSAPRRGAVRSCPIAAAKFLPGEPSPWFGYSGTVQIGQAIESRVWNAPGTKGTIYTVALGDTGRIFFGGDIAGQPIEGYPTNPGQFDPTQHQLWLHHWYYVIPFPAPVVDSTFTYTFDVNVQAALVLVDGPAALYSKVWVGETANFTGQLWPVTSGATVGWPLEGVHLTSTTDYARGQSHVQRSLVVRGGHCPAVLLVVNIAAVLETGSEVIFYDEDSFIVPVSSTGVGEGLVHFHYEPILVAQQ